LLTFTFTFAAGAGAGVFEPTLFTVTVELTLGVVFFRFDRGAAVPIALIAFGLVSTANVDGAPGVGDGISSVGAGA
jgi:hypothetical protein